MATAILSRLRFDGRLTGHVTRIIRLHTRANSYEPDWTDGAVRRFILDAGEGLPALIALSRADITSQRPQRIKTGLARVAELQARCEHLQAKRDVAALESPLDGHALMELFDRPPGGWIKPIKQYLLNLVLDGELEPDDEQRARVLAQAFVQRHTEAAEAIESGMHHAQTSDATHTNSLIMSARDQKRRGAWNRKMRSNSSRSVVGLVVVVIGVGVATQFWFLGVPVIALGALLLLRQPARVRRVTDTAHSGDPSDHRLRLEQRVDQKPKAQRPTPHGQRTPPRREQRAVQEPKARHPSPHVQRARPRPERRAAQQAKVRRPSSHGRRKRSMGLYWPPKRPWPPHWR